MRWLLITLGLLCLACSQTKPPAPAETTVTESEPQEASGDTSAESEQPQQDTEIIVPTGGKHLVKLLESGNEPRRALRWTIAKGLKQSLSIESETQVEGLLGGFLSATGVAQPMTYQMKVRAKDVTPGEPVHVTFKIVKAKADLSKVVEGARARFEEAANTVKGSTGSYSLDSRGIVRDIKIELPSDASLNAHRMAQSIQWSLSQMLVPFPEEPVGQGAKWTAAGVVEIGGGIRVRQLSKVELVKLEGSLVEIKVEVGQNRETSVFDLPTMPGKKAQLVKLDSKGSSQATWHLAEIVPRSASVESAEYKLVRYKVERRKTESSANTARYVSMSGK